jgi:two-component system response regulator MprA
VRPMARILMIDDDPAVRDAMAFLLRVHGYDVITAEDGAKGVAALEAGRVDLVIVDRYMPNMDGITAIKAIRVRLPQIPIIAISGSILDESSASEEIPVGPGFGVLRSLAKPFKPEKLLSVIEELLAAGG